NDVDHIRIRHRPVPVSDGILGDYWVRAFDIEPIVLAESAVPGIAVAANLGKVVKPGFDLRRIAWNRHLEWFRGVGGHHAGRPDLIQQAAAYEITARMKFHHRLEVPDLGATPIPSAAGQSLGVKRNRQIASPGDGTVAGLLPSRQK